MTVSPLLKDVLTRSLEGMHFTRKSASWYLSTDGAVRIVNLQNSQYGQQYYINFAVVFRLAPSVDFPKEHHGDIRFRLASIVPEELREACDSLMDIENTTISDDARGNQLADYLNSYGLPLLMECSSLSRAAKTLECGRLPDWTLSKAARDLFRSQNT